MASDDPALIDSPAVISLALAIRWVEWSNIPTWEANATKVASSITKDANEDRVRFIQ